MFDDIKRQRWQLRRSVTGAQEVGPSLRKEGSQCRSLPDVTDVSAGMLKASTTSLLSRSRHRRWHLLQRFGGLRGNAGSRGRRLPLQQCFLHGINIHHHTSLVRGATAINMVRAGPGNVMCSGAARQADIHIERSKRSRTTSHSCTSCGRATVRHLHCNAHSVITFSVRSCSSCRVSSATLSSAVASLSCRTQSKQLFCCDPPHSQSMGTAARRRRTHALASGEERGHACSRQHVLSEPEHRLL